MDTSRQLIIDLYKHPLNKRKIKDADIANTGTNVACGDRVRIFAKIKNERIVDASFEGEGCSITIASVSLLTEKVKGKSLKKVLKWNSATIFKWLGTELSFARTKCGLLPLETLQEGIRKENTKN